MSEPKESSLREDLIKVVKDLMGGGLVGKAAEKLSGRKKKTDKAVEDAS